MDKDRIAKNIKSLRQAHGETLMDLAYAVGLNSPSSIANYEKGIRNQKSPELLKKIADHYLITQDELLNCDFSGLDIKKIPFDDGNILKAASKETLPIICSNAALGNNSFDKAYDLHMQLFHTMEAGSYFDEISLNDCMELYTEAFENDHCVEAAANLIWWLFIMGIAISQDRMLEGINLLQKGKIDKGAFIKTYYLQDCDEESISDESNKDFKEYIVAINDDMNELFTALTGSNNYSNLGYYYIALRYLYGLVPNSLSRNMNRSVGEEMIVALSNIGNQYAINFLKIAKKI